MSVAWDLEVKLPGTKAAFRDGRLRHSKAVIMENRVKWHRSQVTRTATWNAGLAAFLRKGVPQYQALATVPDDQRYAAERDITRRLRKKYKLLNILDGRAHSEESRRRMREGHARAKASRGTIP